jgi:hypothetical protein
MEDYTINEGMPAKKAEVDNGDPEAEAFARQRYHARLAHSFRLRAQEAKGRERLEAAAAHKFHSAKVKDTITFIKKLREDTDMNELEEAKSAPSNTTLHKAISGVFEKHTKEPGFVRIQHGGRSTATKHSPSFDRTGSTELHTRSKVGPDLEKLAKKYGGKYNSDTGHLDVRSKTHRHFVSASHGTHHSVYTHSNRELSDFDMRNEELELAELSKKTLKSYTHKANQDRTKSFGDEKRYGKRLAGADVAVKKIHEEELAEKVLDIQARMKRAAVMRRYENKIKRSRDLAQRRLAPEKNIKKRAYAAARQILRRKVAGARGAEYAQMGPSEKMAIDRLIDGKTKIIKKIALRLLPRVRAAEHARLASFMKGAALEPQHSNAIATMEAVVDKKVNKEFGAKFKKGEAPSATEKKEVRLHPKESKNVVKFHQKFTEEAALVSDTFKGLCKKAEKSGIDLDILGEVYDRGMDAWVEEMNVSQQQYAFARVNSYINQGKTYFNEDADLQELSKATLRSYLDKSSTRGELPTAAKFRRSVVMGTVAAKKVGQRFPGSKNVKVKVKATNEETVPLVEEDGKTTVVSKGKESGTRWEMRTRLAGEPGEYSSIIKTHQDGKHLQNRWGGYNVYKTGKTPYIKKHFERLALKEETLTEHRGYKAPELEAAGYQFKSHLGATGNRDASTLYYHPALDKHIEITHERTGMAGSKKRHYFYSGKLGSNSGGMQSMHPTLSDAIRKNKGELKEETLNEANRLKYDASGKQWYHSANGGFTWKRVTSDEAKKAYPGKHKDITAEHGLKEETLDEMRNVSTSKLQRIVDRGESDPKGIGPAFGMQIVAARKEILRRKAAGIKEETLDDGGYYAAREMHGNDYAVARHIYDRYRGQHTSKHIDSAIEDLGGDKEKIIKHLGRFRAVKKMHSTGRDPKYTKEETLAEATYHERVKNHPAVESVDNGGKGEYFVNLKHPYHWSGQKSFGVDSPSHALKMLKDVKKGIAGVDFEEEYVAEMSWTKQVQYADAAKKDRLDKFNQSLATKDPAEKAALLKRIDNRNKTIQKVMDRSGWNKKPVAEAVFTVDKEPVIIPPEKKADGSFTPARTVMRRVRKKILNSGNLSDGK